MRRGQHLGVHAQPEVIIGAEIQQGVAVHRGPQAAALHFAKERIPAIGAGIAHALQRAVSLLLQPAWRLTCGRWLWYLGPSHASSAPRSGGIQWVQEPAPASGVL